MFSNPKRDAGRPQPTRWQVITGAPCSGKTSVINALNDKGYRVVNEVARSYIDALLSAGTPLEKIKSDILSFERRILEKKVEIEQLLPKNRLIFMDRAVPDSIAYYRLEGLCDEEPLLHSQAVRYQRIFLFERLSLEKDGIRTEDQVQATRIETLLKNGYEALGYEIIRVPLLSIDERVKFVLDRLDGD